MEKKKIIRFQIFSVIFTWILGTILHFLYEWSGDNKIIASFSAVNESTWEHLKLVFFPTIPRITTYFQEALRLCPSVPMILRELGADQPIAEDVVLPRGTHVLLNLFLVHRDPSQWPQPETFNPERYIFRLKTKFQSIQFPEFDC